MQRHERTSYGQRREHDGAAHRARRSVLHLRRDNALFGRYAASGARHRKPIRGRARGRTAVVTVAVVVLSTGSVSGGRREPVGEQRR